MSHTRKPLSTRSATLMSKTVLSTVNSSPPTHTVDTTIFEMWLGSLSTHQGLSIPVVWRVGSEGPEVVRSMRRGRGLCDS